LKFTPYRKPVFVSWLATGGSFCGRPLDFENDTQNWMQTEIARIEDNRYERYAIHMIGGVGKGEDYHGNARTTITQSHFEIVDTGLAYLSDKVACGLYTGKWPLAAGKRDTDIDNKRLVDFRDISFWQYFEREIYPFYLSCNKNFTWWIDALDKYTTNQLNTVLNPFHIQVCKEAWEFTPLGQIDITQAKKCPAWISIEYFEVMDGSRWKASEFVPAFGPGNKLGSVDPNTTELHIMYNDGHFIKWGPNGEWTPERVLTDQQICDLVAGWIRRGFIVSGYSQYIPSVQEVIKSQNSLTA
jgi:hypothetical protein